MMPRPPVPFRARFLLWGRRNFDRVGRRKLLSHAITVLSGLAVVVILYPLVSIVYTAVRQGGLLLLDPRFYTGLEPLPCSVYQCHTYGIGPAIEGTVVMVGLATLASTLIGVSAAIFASEYRTGLLGRAISFTADVLTGAPSILMGVFIYSYFVLYDPNLAFSALTGTLALTALMLPIVVRTTEEALRTVPNALREAALALGIPKWRATTRIVVATAFPGVLTGILLAAMRAAGDAAPLLYTAFGSRLYATGLDHPISALPLLIYNFALSGQSNEVQVAWGATVFLIIFVLAANILSRWSIARMVRRMGGR